MQSYGTATIRAQSKPGGTRSYDGSIDEASLDGSHGTRAAPQRERRILRDIHAGDTRARRMGTGSGRGIG